MKNLKEYLKINKISRADFALRLGIKENALNVALSSNPIKNIDKLSKIYNLTGLSIRQISDDDLLFNTVIIEDNEKSRKSLAMLELNLRLFYKINSIRIDHFDNKTYITVLYSQAMIKNDYNITKSLEFQKGVFNDVVYQFKLNGIDYKKNYLSFPECILRGE